MNLLLDTCTFLWIALDPSQLSPQALQFFQDPANQVFLSAVSAWEIAVKYGLGRLSLQQPPELFVPQQRAAHRIAELVVREDEALRVARLAALHKDPFDRMLICQALANGLTILTPDPLIRQYAIATAW
jgi:PIN domain nuclease of toxin-antitoxin system